MKNKRSLIILSLLITVILCFGIFQIKGNTTQAEVNVNSVAKLFTQTDTPNGINIIEYKNEFVEYTKIRRYAGINGVKVSLEAGEIFQNNATYFLNGSFSFLASINGDDSITKIIPKELFTYVNEQLYIGKEYGYYINTYIPYRKDYLVSSVILIDVKREYMDDFAFDVTIQPIMQLNYYYLTRENSSITLQGYEGHEPETCTVMMDSNVNNAVVPMVSQGFNTTPASTTNYLQYKESDSYTISDISFISNIKNTNTANYGDGTYNPQVDNGYFFIGSDYSYSATKYSAGGNATSAIKYLGEYAVSSAIGYVPVIGDLYSMTNDAIGIIDAITAVNTSIAYNETNKNYYYEDTVLPPTRRGQLEKYNNLIKYSQMIINTYGSDRLYFKSGDYAKGTFEISHTPTSQDKESTHINVDIAMKIVAKDGSVAEIKSSNYGFALNEGQPIYTELAENNNMYILPEHYIQYKFTPRENGVYIFDMDSKDLELYVNNKLIDMINEKYSKHLNRGQEYVIKIKNNSKELIQKPFVIDCEGVYDEIVMKAGEERLLKLANNNVNHVLLNTGHSDVIFRTLFEKNMISVKDNINKSEFATALSDKDYYVLVKNNSEQDKTVKIKNIEYVDIFETTTSLTIPSNSSIAKFKFYASESKNYIFRIEKRGYNIKIFNKDFCYQPYLVSNFKDARLFEINLKAGDIIYFELTKTYSEDFSNEMIFGLNIKKEVAGKWKVDDKDFTGNRYNVERGKSFNLKLEYAGDIYSTDYANQTSNYKLIYFNDNGNIDIDSLSLLGTYSIEFEIEYTEVFDDLKEIIKIKKFQFIINIIIQNEINNKISAYHLNNGIEISIDKNFINKIKVRVQNGNYERYFELNQDKNYLNGFNQYIPIVSISVVSIWYKLKLDATGNNLTESEANNGSYGVNISPLTANHIFSFGDGTKNNPFDIFRVEQFNKIKNFANGSYYFSQRGNLDFKNSSPDTILTRFYGFYNGNNFNIKNVKIFGQSSNFGGLFSTLSGEIKNINLSINFEVTVTSFIHIGGIVYANYGILDNVIVDGNIKAQTSGAVIGGIAGYNQGNIINSYSKVSIHTRYDVGGITQYNKGNINNCKYFGVLYLYFVESSHAGGISGKSSGSIEKCTVYGSILYKSPESNSRTLAPYIGSISGSIIGKGSVTNCLTAIGRDSGKLKKVTWKEYVFPWWKEYSHDQLKNYAKLQSGQVGNTCNC